MRKVLVSLVSDHTIPNILAIHHFKPDELLFVSTPNMEKNGKSRAILNTLALLGLRYDETNSSVVAVQEDSLLACHSHLSAWSEEREENSFFVNLTGGTKIMSIAAYEVFKDYAAEMIYVPFPRNEFIMVFPRKAMREPIPLDLRLSVVQYLSAYGLRAVNEKTLARHEELALKRQGTSRWIAGNYKETKRFLSWLTADHGAGLRKHRGAKEFHLREAFPDSNSNERKLMRMLGMELHGDVIDKRLTKSDIGFLTGGWLEEFCFNELAAMRQQAGIDDVVIGLQMINKQGRNNEFDVLFTSGNALYTVECKSLDQKGDKGTDVLYKIGALQKDFGLKVGSFLVSTSEYIMRDGVLDPTVQARAEQFNTRIVTSDQLERFSDIVVERLRAKSL